MSINSMEVIISDNPKLSQLLADGKQFLSEYNYELI